MHRVQTNFQIPHPHSFFFFWRGHPDATPSLYLGLSSASFALDKTTVVSMWGAGAGRISGGISGYSPRTVDWVASTTFCCHDRRKRYFKASSALTTLWSLLTLYMKDFRREMKLYLWYHTWAYVNRITPKRKRSLTKSERMLHGFQ